jgi:hypothetical protein
MTETILYVEGLFLGVLHGILIGYMIGRRSKKK